MNQDPATGERTRLKDEILHELASVLVDTYGANHWGRILVEITNNSRGEHVVANIDVRELVGDEREVETLMASPNARAMLGALASAVDALCSLDSVSVDQVGGGTFVRLANDDFGFLPGLVQEPSTFLDQHRDELGRWLNESRSLCTATTGFDERNAFDVDSVSSCLQFTHSKTNEPSSNPLMILGTFTHDTRMFVWAWANPSAPEHLIKRTREALDTVGPRDMWELSTAMFHTDIQTVRLLCARVGQCVEAHRVLELPVDGGTIFTLVGKQRPNSAVDAF